MEMTYFMRAHKPLPLLALPFVPVVGGGLVVVGVDGFADGFLCWGGLVRNLEDEVQ